MFTRVESRDDFPTAEGPGEKRGKERWEGVRKGWGGERGGVKRGGRV